MKYEYDMNIPVPQKHTGGSPRGGRYDVLRHMPVGGSWFFAGASEAVMRASWRTLRTREGLASKFTARTVTENGVKGVRVWRIE